MGTPLICSPLLVWGGLASGFLEPPYAAFGLAIVMPLLVHSCALPSSSRVGDVAYRSGHSGSKPVKRRPQQLMALPGGGTPWVGSAELKLLAVAACLLPSLVHVVMHYQVHTRRHWILE